MGMEQGILTGLSQWGVNPAVDAIRYVMLFIMALPIVVFISALMPWRHEVEKAFDEPKEGMVSYLWLSGILIIVALATLLPSVLRNMGVNAPSLPGVISFLGLFFTIVLLLAYYKRVVRNKVMRRYRKEMKIQKKQKS